MKTLELDLGGAAVHVGCELDDVWEDATVQLPAVLSAAERLIDPCKIKDPTVWARVDGRLIERVTAGMLGPGPWGAEGSATTVGEIRTEHIARGREVFTGPVAEQVATVVGRLAALGLLVPSNLHGQLDEPVPVTGGAGPLVAVLTERQRDRPTRELLSGAARLARSLDGRVVAVGQSGVTPEVLTTWGADEVVDLTGSLVAEDVARVLIAWAHAVSPWAVLAAGTPWGREVAARAAASLGAGLTGDAVGLAVDGQRLVAWKPAFGGALLAAIRCTSPLQMATVRPGVLSCLRPRAAAEAPVHRVEAVTARGRVQVHARRFEDDGNVLAGAEMVIGVGQAVPVDRYGELDGLRAVLGAELAATRKVTDQGWMPHARQLGITGASIAPRLYLALGTSGKFNHMVGVRAAGTIVAVNPDPAAAVFDFADLGIVGSWDVVVAELERQLRAAR